ncbi:hypothetical protein [Nonomuraea sp. NPDC005650]|uniref:hypothetical protein n=1 Tax=Nonomuraea sp. NPDC005650 TaxID=3157045 RepID=UPI0033AE5472
MPIKYVIEIFQGLRPQAVTAASAESLVKASGLTSASVRINGGAQAERDILLWLLASCAPQPLQNQTNHQILPLAEGENPPLGQVILHYENSVGTATLVGRGLPAGPPPQSQDVSQLKNQLAGEYGLAGISGNWMLDHLTKLHYALSLVPRDDRPALRGVQVERLGLLRAGVGGHNKAKFSQEAGPWTVARGTLQVADAAFDQDRLGFYGGATSQAWPPSVQAILHEVGHAVECANRRHESWENATWVVGGDPAAVRQNQVDDAVELQIDAEELGRRGSGLPSARVADYNYLAETYEQIGTWIEAGNGGNHEPEATYVTLKSQVAKKLSDGLWDVYRQAIERWCDGEIRAARWRQKYRTPQGYITPRLAAFSRYVGDNGVGKNLTPYAMTADGELFAEAYSFWLVDHDAVAGHNPLLSGYFDAGRHRQS